jgi:hypothetical protein
MKIHCEQIADPAITVRIAKRYETEIDILRRLQFQDFCYYNERLFPFSAVAYFIPLLLMRLYREVIQFRRPLRISTNHPLLIAPRHATYGLVMGMGVKFYTVFTDGTVLISANFHSREIHDDRRKVYKHATPGSIHTAWQSHQQLITALQGQEKTFDEPMHFDTYVRASTTAEK